MKKVKDWFKMLPKDESRRAIANTSKKQLESEAPDLWHALVTSFVWNDSPEKVLYWVRVSDNIVK